MGYGIYFGGRGVPIEKQISILWSVLLQPGGSRLSLKVQEIYTSLEN